jgi:hypothetical protein
LQYCKSDPDFIDPQSWNGYPYVINNPLNFVDPDGLEYRICNSEGKCWTHDDEHVRNAKKAGGFTWVGSRSDRTGLDSGTIYNEDGSVAGTYQQTSHDSQIQRMLWGAAPTIDTWKPVIDALSPLVTLPALPAGGAATTGASVTRAATTMADTARVAKNAQLAVNGAKGGMSEALVLAKLAEDGVEVVGT